MIGVGTDIIEIGRIEEAIKRTPLFLQKLCTEEELAYIASRSYCAETIAGHFAAKEAVSKALGTGFRSFSMQDVVITRDALGKPEVMLYAGAKERFGAIGGHTIALSISHCKAYAVAFCTID